MRTTELKYSYEKQKWISKENITKKKWIKFTGDISLDPFRIYVVVRLFGFINIKLDLTEWISNLFKSNKSKFNNL